MTKLKTSAPASPAFAKKVPIKNAGLVILHPFLETYFTRCGVMANRMFVDATAQARAVHLLQYLVFERTQDAAPDLLLNKLLCGLPWFSPVPANLEITESEKSISLELITAVLHRWDKLPNTSPEGFRTSFLQRAGALRETEGDWIVRVHPKPFDVLLQTIPWALDIVKNPWMEKLILVEWL